MKRVVMPEWLDEMAAEATEAIRSRRDLQRLNFFLGHKRQMFNVLSALAKGGRPPRFVEIGAGDGTFMRGLAEMLSTAGRQASGSVLLVDRRPSVAPDTRKAFESVGWKVDVVKADVFDWLPGAAPADAIVANLFLHHFETEPLARLLALAAGKCGWFVACEPRRAAPALAASRLLWLLGCNAVTRHDAVISVQAGFREQELSSLWPVEGWALREGRAGLFSHLFVAKKNEVAK